MMLLKKQVNIHKVISNVKCTVEDGSLSVSFNNTAIGTIIALKLTLKGLNNAGKSVTINGQKSFPVMISNILVAPNQKASKLKAELPSAEISKVEVQQIQVIYQENSRILDVPEQKMVVLSHITCHGMDLCVRKSERQDYRKMYQLRRRIQHR